jgi:hypothetical protein
MSTSLSVAEILARLEARLAHHEEQVAFHQRQEVHHREQSAAHAAELETVIMTSKLIARVVHRLGEDETFGASQVAQETNPRYRGPLKKPVDARMPRSSSAAWKTDQEGASSPRPDFLHPGHSGDRDRSLSGVRFIEGVFYVGEGLVPSLAPEGRPLNSLGWQPQV